MQPDRYIYRLTFQAQPDDVPAVVRLRRLLKLALRVFGFRCVSAEEIALPNGKPAAELWNKTEWQ
ncbi:MAG: hypothetical protein KatS3mg105_4409 [Gemmatales bacterium]|nr:MAG: hypothetical protein KatS3mg105_4409 [Gemmatales bacterium]